MNIDLLWLMALFAVSFMGSASGVFFAFNRMQANAISIDIHHLNIQVKPEDVEKIKAEWNEWHRDGRTKRMKYGVWVPYTACISLSRRNSLVYFSRAT